VKLGAWLPADRDAIASEAGAIEHTQLACARVPVSWARMQPRPGEFDGSEVEAVRERLVRLSDRGVEPLVALWHAETPGWFLDELGWADDRARSRWWPRYVDGCGERLGDVAAAWLPMHDPLGWARAVEADDERHSALVTGLMRGWREAWDQLRGGGVPVITAFRLEPGFALDGTIPAERAVAAHDAATWQLVIWALRDGLLRVPGRAEIELPELRDAYDIAGFCGGGAVGFEMAEPRRATARPYPRRARVDDRGRAPWAEELGASIRRLADALPGRPVSIVEWGVTTRDDRWRADELRQMVEAVDDAARDGVAVGHVLVRSLLDGVHTDGLCEADGTPKGSAIEAAASSARWRAIASS
jgi:beta-glucosidase